MLYAGTYSVRGSEGIYALRFDGDTGALEVIGALGGLRNPSFLAAHPSGRWLYAVCEEERAAAVAAVALEGETGEGRVLNWQSTGGAGPCHVAVDPCGEWVVTANYGSGAVSLHRVLPDGKVGETADLAQHEGSGPVADRQEGPHAHSANFDPSGRFVIAPDLGIDRLMVYELDRQAGKLRLHEAVVVAAGAGPRHFAFHPNGQWAYLITELANTVVVYRWDGETGALTEVQTVSALPEGWSGTSYCADIHVHPNGKFLYGSNRGHDSLAIFRVGDGGLLEAAGHVPTGGEHPRNFAVTADGRWVLAANMHSDSIVVFAVGEDGGLVAVGKPLPLPSPACLLFVDRT
ncbi:MAG: lactonase family protein [Phycisphaerae bacterium]